MLQLLKRDFYLMQNYAVAMLAIPVLFKIIHMPDIPFTTYIILIYIFWGATFFSETKANVNRFFISLPIKKDRTVLARYVTVTVCTTVLTGLVLSFEKTFSDRLDGYSLITILFIFTIVYVIIAVALPIYYLFDVFWQAYLCQLFIFAFGGFLFLGIVITDIFNPIIEVILTMLDRNPPLFLGLFSCLMLIVSYLISRKIYIQKDF